MPRKLEGICLDLALLMEQGKVEDFISNIRSADRFVGILEDILKAVMDYQVCMLLNCLLLQCLIFEPGFIATSYIQGSMSAHCELHPSSPHPYWLNSRQEQADLALLGGMNHAPGAGYRCGNRHGCLQGTRKDVLWQIESWLGDKMDQHVFWLNGLAGTGKTAIAQTFAETSSAVGKLGASFFCSKDHSHRSNIQTIFPTLAIQLAYQYPEFRKVLLPILRASPNIKEESLCSQLEKVIIGPLKATCIQTLIIIDALDECYDEEPISSILFVLSRYLDQTQGVKFFITSRPQPQICSGFQLELLQPITEVFKLHNVEQSLVDADMRLYLETHLAKITETRSDCDSTESWPSSYDIDLLCREIAGVFIYASMVVKFIASCNHVPAERLALIISPFQRTPYKEESRVSPLYTQALEYILKDLGPNSQELYSCYKPVVATVLLAFHPLSKELLSEILKRCNTGFCTSITLLPSGDVLHLLDREVDSHHTFGRSFSNFLANPERYKDKGFFVDPLFHHLDILFSCLDLMKERLKKNICGLDGCPLLSDVKDLPNCREAHIGSPLEYTCLFWTKHLSEIPVNGPHIEQVKVAIDKFFTTHLLFWIEVLSLIEHLDFGIHALHDIDRWYLLVSSLGYWLRHTLMCIQTGDSCKWTKDSEHLILSNFDSIHGSPATIYCQALPFCPSSSWLHKWYTSESLQGVKVVKGCPGNWGTCTHVVSFHHYPEALAYWKDTLVVGLGSGDIIVLDAITGSSRSVLSGHVESVTSLAFSTDGALLVSGSFDDTIKLWNIQSGRVIKTFYGQGWAHSLSISPDATTIASISSGGICLWGVRTGECDHIIDTALTSDGVACLHFLPTIPTHFVSLSGGLVQQWDIKGSKIGPTISGHHITFSSDGKHFILCDNGPPTLHHTTSRNIIATLHSPSQDFSRCCFSPSNQFVAGVAHATVYVWKVTSTPYLFDTFIPHGTSIFSLVYTTTSLLSMHSDGKIRFRRIYSDSPVPTTRDTISTEFAQAKIIYTTLQEGIAISIDLAGIIKHWDLLTGLSKNLLQVPEMQCVGSARLVNTTLSIVHCDHLSDSGWGVSAWDISTGDRLQNISLSGDLSILDPTFNHDLGISKDGAIFFVVDPVKLQTWSILTGENIGSLFHYNYTRSSTPLSINLDGSIVWICSLSRLKAWGWNLKDLKSPPLDSSNMPDRLRLACLQDVGGVWDDAGQSRIMDTTSKLEVFRLPKQFADCGRAVWDGRYLFVFYDAGEPLILDFVHLALPQ